MISLPWSPLWQLDPQSLIAGEDDRRAALATDDLGEAGEVGGEASEQKEEPGDQPCQHPHHVQPRPHHQGVEAGVKSVKVKLLQKLLSVALKNPFNYFETKVLR